MLAGLKTVGEVLLSAVAPMFKEVILILKTRRIAFRTEVKAIGHSATLGVGARMRESEALLNRTFCDRRGMEPVRCRRGIISDARKSTCVEESIGVVIGIFECSDKLSLVLHVIEGDDPVITLLNVTKGVLSMVNFLKQSVVVDVGRRPSLYLTG